MAPAAIAISATSAETVVVAAALATVFARRANRSRRGERPGGNCPGLWVFLRRLGCAFTPAQPSSSQPTSSPIVQSTVGPPSATDTPTSPPTATPEGPRPLTGATIGGVQDSFTSAFGDRRVQGSASRYSFTTADGLAAIVQIQTQNGMDRQPHVAFLTEAPNGSGPWTVNQSQAVARLFMPPDTKHVRDFTDPQLGTIQVYQSADLAATFPAADFTDSGTGAALPPGTFGLSCGD